MFAKCSGKTTEIGTESTEGGLKRLWQRESKKKGKKESYTERRHVL